MCPCRRWHLTHPSSDVAKAAAAPFAPPLMSNVRSLSMRPLIRSLYLVSLALVCFPTAASADDQNLVGCSLSTEIVQYALDGESRTNSAQCQTRYFDGWIESLCPTPQGVASVTYDYTVTRPGVYVATMTGNQLLPQLVGGTREHFFRIEGDVLCITTYRQTTQLSPPTAAVRVESRSERRPCD